MYQSISTEHEVLVDRAKKLHTRRILSQNRMGMWEFLLDIMPNEGDLKQYRDETELQLQLIHEAGLEHLLGF
jgi:hypothetical protein